MRDTTRLTDSSNRLFFVEHNGQSFVVLRPLTFQNALDVVCNHFPGLRKNHRSQLQLQTDKLEDAGGRFVSISEESWAIVSKLIDGVHVSVASFSDSEPHGTKHTLAADRTHFTVKTDFFGHVRSFRVPSSMTCARLRAAIFREYGFPAYRARIWDLPHSDELVVAELEDSESFLILWEQGGGMSQGISLLSPRTLRADVHLTLSPLWKEPRCWMSPAIETRTPRKDYSYDFDLHWIVDVEADGPMKTVVPEFTSNSLTWHASPADNGSHDMQVTDDNSVLIPIIPVQHLSDYLSSCFINLGAPSTMREDMLTTCLQCVIGYHTHIAVRFISQDLLATHAKLSVSPVPDVQGRVIMLFKAIPVEQSENWPKASDRLQLGGKHWRDVVGITPELLHLEDKNLFRAFEWGIINVDQDSRLMLRNA